MQYIKYAAHGTNKVGLFSKLPILDDGGQGGGDL